MRSCAFAGGSGHPRHLSYDCRELVEVVSETMSFVLQVPHALLPALLVPAHSIENGFEILLLTRPLVGHGIQVTTELFRSSLAPLDVQESRVHRSRRPLDDRLDFLVPFHKLRAELLVFQHGAKHIGMRHRQLQKVDALCNVLDRKIEVFGGPLQKVVDFVYMCLQDLHHLFIRFGSLLMQQVHAEHDLRHEFGQRMVSRTGLLPPSRRPGIVVLSSFQ
jgi:hypothetical protein